MGLGWVAIGCRCWIRWGLGLIRCGSWLGVLGLG